MTTQQILFSALILGATTNITLTMEENWNKRRFNNGWDTHLNDNKYCNISMSALNIHCTSNDMIKLIEITHDNKLVERGTIKELKESNLGSSKFGGIWNPVSRNNAIFDPLEQAIFYGNTLEKHQPMKKKLLLMEKKIQLANKQLQLNKEEFAQCNCKIKNDECEAINQKIEAAEQELNTLYEIYRKL